MATEPRSGSPTTASSSSSASASASASASGESVDNATVDVHGSDANTRPSKTKSELVSQLFRTATRLTQDLSLRAAQKLLADICGFHCPAPELLVILGYNPEHRVSAIALSDFETLVAYYTKEISPSGAKRDVIANSNNTDGGADGSGAQANSIPATATETETENKNGTAAENSNDENSSCENSNANGNANAKRGSPDQQQQQPPPSSWSDEQLCAKLAKVVAEVAARDAPFVPKFKIGAEVEAFREGEWMPCTVQRYDDMLCAYTVEFKPLLVRDNRNHNHNHNSHSNSHSNSKNGRNNNKSKSKSQSQSKNSNQ